jgi:LuxR family transcriptional regulator, maltose regulon positive regulatory protein
MSKLDPPEAGRSVLSRPRLIDRLASAAHGQITLVTAPVGAGKTTLLRSWLAAGRVPGVPVWVSLDAADRDPGTFWSYVLAGLERVGLAVPSGEIEPAGTPVRLLAAALYGRAEPVVLVLDDADLLAGSEVPEELDFLARHAGSALRLVLASHGDPQVHRLRRRLDGSVTDIRADDLAATEAEAREIFALHGVTPSEECVRAVLRRTGGWMAGVTLTALAAAERLGAAGPDREHDDRAVATAADADIADYLDAEVLAPLPPADVQLLFQVGLVEHVPGALAVELSGRPAARQALDDLGRRTSLLQRCRRHEDCHRIDPLLVRLLAGRRSAGSSRRLHRRAGEWCAAGDRSVDAAIHLATAQDWPEAASALVNGYAVAHLSAGPHARRLLAVFSGMPPDSPGAQSAVVLAAAAVARGDAEVAAKQLGRAEELVDDVPPERAGALALALAVAGAGLARLSGDADRAMEARAALDRATAEIEAGGGSAGAGSRTTVLAEVGAALLRAGRLDAAAATLAEDLAGDAAAAPPPLSAVRSVLTARAALVEALRGHLTAARELAERAGADPVPADPVPPDGRRRHGPAEALAALALVAVETGSAVEADQPADQPADHPADSPAVSPANRPAGRRADSRAARPAGQRADSPADRPAGQRMGSAAGQPAGRVAGGDDPVVPAVLGLVRARSLRAAGQPDQALSVLAATRHPAGREGPPAWLDGMLAAAAAGVWTASGRPEQALRELAEAGHGGPDVCLETARAHLASGEVERATGEVAALLRRGDLTLGVRVEAWLLRAEAALAGQDRKVAEQAADRALRAASEQRLLRPVWEAPPQLRGLLQAAGPDVVGLRRGTGAGRGRRPGVGSRGASPQRPAPTPGRPVVVEPLTAREQEVLGYLSALLSTKEIAELMFVSVNTVKSHVRGILRKLGAPRRNEAIRRARELQLV